MTESKRYSLTLDTSIMQRIFELCAVSCGLETGGVIVGHYSAKHDEAIVTDVSGPPRDSTRSRVTFNRGTDGLQQWINSLWARERRFYIGEWHFHPYASSHPSHDDIQQMHINAEKTALSCPEPILLIIGGNPPREWNVSAHVFPRGRSPQEMILTNNNHGAIR